MSAPSPKSSPAPQPLHGPELIEFGDLLPGFQLSVRELFDSLKLA